MGHIKDYMDALEEAKETHRFAERVIRLFRRALDDGDLSPEEVHQELDRYVPEYRQLPMVPEYIRQALFGPSTTEAPSPPDAHQAPTGRAPRR